MEMEPVDLTGFGERLYVVGQDIGGLFDSTYDLRCEGSASSFAMTSGRIAAEHAIKMIEEGK